MAAEIEVSVEGMTCTGCENNLRFALSALAGVQRAKANFQGGGGRGRLRLRPDEREEELRQAIEEIGYTVVATAA